MNNKYFLIRHGQSTYNNMGRHQGWKARIPLSSQGKAEARIIGQKLKSLEEIDVLSASSLLRARQTAKIIGEIVGVTPKFYKKIIDYRKSKKFEGIFSSEYKNNPDYLLWETESRQNTSFSLSDGESLDNFWKRIHEFINQIERIHQYKKITVVTHRGVIKEIIKYLTKDSKEINTIENCKLFILEPSPSGYKLSFGKI